MVLPVYSYHMLYNHVGMRSMFSIFAYYFAQAFVGLLPISFGDNE